MEIAHSTGGGTTTHLSGREKHDMKNDFMEMFILSL
jgi:hypothetical protein